MVGSPTSFCTRAFRFSRYSAQPSLCASSLWVLTSYSLLVCLGFLLIAVCSLPSRSEAAPGVDVPLRHIRTTIPILGTTMNEEAEPVGIVADIQLEFLQRRDHDGLRKYLRTAMMSEASRARRAGASADRRVAVVLQPQLASAAHQHMQIGIQRYLTGG